MELPGCNAVKFQIRDLEHELTTEAWQAPYENENSFGDTYGEHRLELELHLMDYEDLAEYARMRGLEVVVTACQHTVVDEINQYIKPERWKVASRDLGNVPLLKRLAKLDPTTIILSTGMATHSDIDRALVHFSNTTHEIWLLHCISEYPARYGNLQLRGIIQLQQYIQKGTFASKTCKRVGFSDHTAGVMAPALAVMLGATVIEKHITVDHDMKGSDHAGSMDREGFRRVVRDIRNAELANQYCGRMDTGLISPGEGATWEKIGRSVAYTRNLQIGTELQEDDLVMVSPPEGLDWEQAMELIGQPLKINTHRNQLLSPEHF